MNKVRKDGSAATDGGLCQDPHYEHLNNPKFEVEGLQTLLQQSSNREPSVGEKISGYESVNYDPTLEQAAMEYHGQPEEEMANSLVLDRQGNKANEVLPGSGDEAIQAREMSQDQSIHESPQNSTYEGDCEIISGYERVRYSPRLEQVLLEISRRRDREKSIDKSASCVSTHGGPGGSDTQLECKCINVDSWMEQALLEYHCPTVSLSYRLTVLPSYSLTVLPSHCPTVSPSYRLTVLPSYRLTVLPSYRLTVLPSHCPTVSLSYRLTVLPSYRLTVLLSYRLTVLPSHCPTVSLSYRLTVIPSHCPTVLPSHCPTVLPSHCPTVSLSYRLTVLPSHCHTISLSYRPTVSLSYCPTVSLSYRLTVLPSHCPTVSLSYRLTVILSHCPTVIP